MRYEKLTTTKKRNRQNMHYGDENFLEKKPAKYPAHQNSILVNCRLRKKHSLTWDGKGIFKGSYCSNTVTITVVSDPSS
jgi:hypothetical protein